MRLSFCAILNYNEIMNDNFFQHMMNRGFLIFEAGTKFVLTKLPTPADPRPAITDEVKANTSELEFDSWDAAVAKAKYLCQWQDQVNETIPHQNGTGWLMQMMYQHRGLGRKVAELGEVGPVSYDKAKAEAEERARRYVEDGFAEGEIERWEVRIRPFKKSISTTSPTSQNTAINGISDF